MLIYLYFTLKKRTLISIILKIIFDIMATLNCLFVSSRQKCSRRFVVVSSLFEPYWKDNFLRMEDLSGCFEGLTVPPSSSSVATSPKQHPRFSQFKVKSAKISQEERRKLTLESQKQLRF